MTKVIERPILHDVMRRAADKLVPLQVTLELTYRCNLSCKHCYADTPLQGELSLAEIRDILDQLAVGGAKSSKTGGELKLGVSTLPPLPKDCTDRNRTSPFAFTGDKFEFRMVGSTQSTSGPMFVQQTYKVMP